jgi:hypothetical protein
MASPRRKNMKIPPIAVVRTSLVSNPVASVSAADKTSFSAVLIEAIRAPRSNDSGHARYVEPSTKTADKTKANVTALATSPFQHNSSVDLYVQLDTLLREKSLLIAVV